ncbi:uncharacterized protein LOC144139237 [Haemaphysalis longicornis]
MERPAGSTTGRGGTPGGRRGGRTFRGHGRRPRRTGGQRKFPRHHPRGPGAATPGARAESASGASGSAQQSLAAATPLPPGRTVATWTCQEGRAAPLFYASRAPWGDQRRVEWGQRSVPYPFVGHTISDHDAAAGGAHLPLPEDAICCGKCGQVMVHAAHSSGRLHPPPAKDAANVGNKPTVASAAELSDVELAALCRRRMAADPGFAAMVAPIVHPTPGSGIEAGTQHRTPPQEPSQTGEMSGGQENSR